MQWSLFREALAVVLGVVLCVGWWALSPVVFLGREEQLLVVSPWDRATYEGPGVVFYTPVLKRGRKRKAVLVDEESYAAFKDELAGTTRTVEGPGLVFLCAYEKVDRLARKYVLRENEYAKFKSAVTGRLRVVKGPSTVAPDALEELAERRDAVVLGPTDYCTLRDAATGALRVVAGEGVVFPEATEEIVERAKGYELGKSQYVKFADTKTGQVRVERGDQVVFPTATERALLPTTTTATTPTTPTTTTATTRGGKASASAAVQEAVFVDAETAALVSSRETGQQRLVTERGLFFPGPHDEVIEVRKLIRVEPHEVAVVVDDEGIFHFYDGRRSGETAFFLPPHHALYTMFWGSGTSAADLKSGVVKNAKTVAYKVPVQKIDLRASYAFFEYNVRTKDNVELVLEGTIFWQVLDVPTMIEATADPKGDVWYHARSALIQAVSKVTLETFMTSFNDIVSSAAVDDTKFYADRGVALHALEVTRYECADPKTGEVLQQIIQETTNRINDLQKQASANDVKRQQVAGDVDVEIQRTALLQAKTANDKTLAEMDGLANGLKLATSVDAFVSHLEPMIPDLDKRLDLLSFFLTNDLAEKQAEALGRDAHLFLTPDNFQLKFNTAGASSSPRAGTA